ncbi:MAG: hypothetical protein B1H08_01560 [Candidatus Omnitrophica bacterium 4484_171]|nr:MAG: hypothetical protein B1H08_01560 [Candidatus Omnitrophica bacterium 4484_171]
MRIFRKGLILSQMGFRKKESVSVKHNSFTLIETLVGVIILGLIMVVMTRVFISAQMSYSKQGSNVLVLSEGRWALEFMSNELRCATVSSIKTTGFWPNYWNGKRIEFQGDIDNDGSLENVRYQRIRSGWTFINKLGRSVKPGWWWSTPIDMTALIPLNNSATIFSDDGSGLITIELTLRPRPDLSEKRWNRSITFRTKVRARNP